MSGDIYVVYKGNEVIAISTVAEVSGALGIKWSTVEYLATQVAHRKGGTSRRRTVAERVRECDVI